MSYQPKVQTWASNARARPYSQEDFDQRDLRLIGKAWAKFEEMQAAAVGNAPAWMRDSKAIVNWICESAGITPREVQTWLDNGLLEAEMIRQKNSWISSGSGSLPSE